MEFSYSKAKMLSAYLLEWKFPQYTCADNHLKLTAHSPISLQETIHQKIHEKCPHNIQAPKAKVTNDKSNIQEPNAMRSTNFSLVNTRIIVYNGIVNINTKSGIFCGSSPYWNKRTRAFSQISKGTRKFQTLPFFSLKYLIPKQTSWF